MSLYGMNFLIQFLTLAVFLASLAFKWKRRYFIHGALMLVAVISYLASFCWSMSYAASEYSVTEVIDAFFANSLTLSVFAIYTLLGVLSGLLAIWILGSWRLQPTHFCTKNRKKMRYAAVLWISFFVMGVLLYELLLNNLLFSRFIF